ncbi:hypothetical protein [Pseudomonas rustica]|uniref:Uncharacterized protein n=1 Tax=Pseudomonas rustica TaxID=2827099 RepID=A0ABS5N085_9PSED|nr:hypothetical protein [Pseudomonas rustica]MBS4079626.1 hypothetical protein [Pseudomonas rustica]
MDVFSGDEYIALALRLHHGLSDIQGDDVPLFERFIANGWATGEPSDVSGQRTYSNAMLLPVCYKALNLTPERLVSSNDR